MPEIGNNTVKADIDLVDETFDISQTESYHLSVQTVPGRLSFCVFNTVINKYILLRNYPLSESNSLVNECSAIFENDHLLGLRYKSSSHLLVSPHCTLVPEHLFDPGEADAYLEFNHGAIAGESTLQNYLRPAGLYNIFSSPEALIALLRLHQHNVNFFHQATPFIESIVAEMPSSSGLGMAVYFYSHYLDIVVAANKKLLFYNTFPINAPEDSVYYLAGVSNLFDIDLLSTRLMYAGTFRHMPPEAAILKKHVERIVECEPSKTVTYSHYIIEPFRKNFINLFNLYGCGS
jgi:hypothetical protein